MDQDKLKVPRNKDEILNDEIINKLLNDKTMNELVKKRIASIERRYALMNFGLAILGIIIICVIYILYFKYFSPSLILIPIGLILFLLILLFKSVGKLFSGKPDKEFIENFLNRKP